MPFEAQLDSMMNCVDTIGRPFFARSLLVLNICRREAQLAQAEDAALKKVLRSATHAIAMASRKDLGVAEVNEAFQTWTKYTFDYLEGKCARLGEMIHESERSSHGVLRALKDYRDAIIPQMGHASQRDSVSRPLITFQEKQQRNPADFLPIVSVRNQNDDLDGPDKISALVASSDNTIDDLLFFFVNHGFVQLSQHPHFYDKVYGSDGYDYQVLEPWRTLDTCPLSLYLIHNTERKPYFLMTVSQEVHHRTWHNGKVVQRDYITSLDRDLSTPGSYLQHKSNSVGVIRGMFDTRTWGDLPPQDVLEFHHDWALHPSPVADVNPFHERTYGYPGAVIIPPSNYRRPSSIHSATTSSHSSPMLRACEPPKPTVFYGPTNAPTPNRRPPNPQIVQEKPIPQRRIMKKKEQCVIM